MVGSSKKWVNNGVLFLQGQKTDARNKQKNHPTPRKKTCSSRQKEVFQVTLAKNRVITERDIAIMQEINRFGFMTVAEVARLFSIQEQRAYHRLKIMCNFELLQHQRLLHNIPGAYWLTRHGQNACKSALSPIKAPRLATFEHELRVIRVYLNLRERYGSALSWITPREILSTKVAQAQTFKQAFAAMKSKTPDGIAMHDTKRFAIEVELSLKGNVRLKKIIADYARSIHESTFDAVLYYTDQQHIAKKLEDIIAAVAGSTTARFKIGMLK